MWNPVIFPLATKLGIDVYNFTLVSTEAFVARPEREILLKLKLQTLGGCGGRERVNRYPNNNISSKSVRIGICVKFYRNPKIIQKFKGASWKNLLWASNESLQFDTIMSSSLSCYRSVWNFIETRSLFKISDLRDERGKGESSSDYGLINLYSFQGYSST